jgi:hypothetical protein
MAKFKAARTKTARSKAPSARGAIPCMILFVAAMALLFLIFYAILKQS